LSKNVAANHSGGATSAPFPSDPGENTIVHASALQSAGREVCTDYHVLGTVPALNAGRADISANNPWLSRWVGL